MAHVSTFEFPIKDLGVTQMHIIPPSLPNFHGLANEDPHTFMFEFEILCRGYDYCTNDQRLKVFPLTLKGAALRWFMSLGGNCIQSWEDMKNIFLKKYQDYCKANEDIFDMIQGEDESLEDYVDRFHYNLQKSKYKHLEKEILKTRLLKGIKDEFLELLNLIGKGDVFQLSYDDVCELCIRYSRGISKAGKNPRDVFSLFSKSATRTGDIRAEINVLFEHFKVDFISSLNEKLDVLQVHKNEECDEMFCSHDRKEHLIDIHSSLPRMEVAYQRGKKAATRPIGMVQNTLSSLSYLHNPLWNANVLGQPCQFQYNHLSCLQVGHGSSYDGMTTLPHLVAQAHSPYSPPALSQHLACPFTQPNQPHHQNAPAQLISHPHHNKPVQHAYNVELENLPTLPTHSISHVLLEKTYNEIQNVSNAKIVEAMEENEVSFTMHQQAILKAQELHDMMAMRNQENKGYIEDWFHSIICLQHHSMLQQFLIPFFEGKLASHTLISINMHFSNLGMCIREAVFRKWLHWKYSYT